MSEQPITIELDEKTLSQIYDSLEDASYAMRRAASVFSMLYEGIANGYMEGSAETMAVCEFSACALEKKADDNTQELELLIAKIRPMVIKVRAMEGRS